MKRKSTSKQSHLAREELVACVKNSIAALLSNVPVAMTDLPPEMKFGFALLSFVVVGFRIAEGMTIWVVRVKL